MNTNNFIETLLRTHPGGMYIHPIKEEGSFAIAYIKDFLIHKKNYLLYVAHEYLKPLNKKLNSNYTLQDFDELKEYKELVDEIINFGK